MANDLVFHTHPQSRGRIARWMLEEVGAPYRVEPVRYGDERKSERYRRINPMGKVPAICLNMMETLEKRPAFIDYSERVSARPAQQRASALDDQLNADMDLPG